MAKWLGLLYAYKGLLLAVGCYMAWETRQVKIPALNDSQYIGLSVYNVVLTSVLVVALANVISVERYGLTFLVVSSLILASTTTTLCLLFLPKILRLLRHPDGNAVVASTGMKVQSNTRRFLVDEKREVVFRAEIQNRVYHTELFELDMELCRLRSISESLDKDDLSSPSSTDDEHQMLERADHRPSLLERLRRVSVSWDPSSGDSGDAQRKRGPGLRGCAEGRALHVSKLFSVRPLNDPRRCLHLSLSGQLQTSEGPSDVGRFRPGSSPVLAYRTKEEEEEEDPRMFSAGEISASPWPSTGSFGESEYFSVTQGHSLLDDKAANSYSSSDTVTWWTAPPNLQGSGSIFSLRDSDFWLQDPVPSAPQEPVYTLPDPALNSEESQPACQEPSSAAALLLKQKESILRGIEQLQAMEL